MSESYDLVLRGDVVTAETVIADAFVAVRGGSIVQVGRGAPPRAARTDDHRGSLLFPGLVDAQVHAGSYEGVVGLRDATRAAAAGGVTTIVDMPFDEPSPVNDVELLETKVAKVRELAAIDVALYVTARKDRNYRPLALMAERG